ncbi:formimidoylglutamase [Sporosarcina sp. G11-34]|uniref:formimidoylglutamase n=1 Tax=Sporosarcina sp. G11-34 TaxID=2849605 RepID=UPI0022A98275|nr:formimidoylglutamase [Sporosarcina sp. G11-34]MCZ2257405.1 formimidoylglutamase [Sporosarcina sp. G11-34]
MKNSFKNIWSGRTDHLTNRASFRYHQVIEPATVDNLSGSNETCALIGFESDEGVRRNKGLLGAATAPNELRKELAKLPWKFPIEKQIVDLGNITCQGNELEKAQQELGETIFNVLSKATTPIILGGGHETAYGHYSGVRKYIGEDASLGIINIDAHFDIRSYEEQTSSGTMFRQILENDERTDYLVLGIQRYGNTQELFDKADKFGVTYIYEEAMAVGNTDTILEKFIDQHDFVMLTLCTDVLNAAFAPGVSAPSPFGLDPAIVRSIIQTVTSHKKTLSFDISEVNPVLDENNRTVKLGAYLTNEAITSFLGRNINVTRT